MYDYYRDMLVIPGRALYEGLGVMSKSNYKKLCHLGKLNRVRQGKGLDNCALVEFGSIPDRFRMEILKKLGLPDGNKLSTTGEELETTAPGSEGKVRRTTLGDLQRMRNFFIKMNAWTEGNMYSLLPVEMEAQLFPADSITTATYMSQVSEKERQMGIIAKVQGWQLLSRSRVYVMRPDDKYKPGGALSEKDDVDAGLFWNKNMVEKAIGKTEIFERIKDPQYYGDIYSFLVRVGSRAKRSDYKGVGVLRQARV